MPSSTTTPTSATSRRSSSGSKRCADRRRAIPTLAGDGPGTPVVCSLGAGDLQQRLAAIGEIGRKGLIDHQKDDGKHPLHFRSNPETRESLAAIVEAEMATAFASGAGQIKA